MRAIAKDQVTEGTWPNPRSLGRYCIRMPGSWLGTLANGRSLWELQFTHVENYEHFQTLESAFVCSFSHGSLQGSFVWSWVAGICRVQQKESGPTGDERPYFSRRRSSPMPAAALFSVSQPRFLHRGEP